MRRLLPILVAFTLAVPAWPSLARADDINLPPRRPGLWAHTMITGPNTTESQSCIDAATDHAMLQHGIDIMRRDGGTVTVTSSGSQLHVASSADLSGHAMTFVEDFTLLNDTTMQGRGHMRIDPPYEPGQEENDIRQDSHWIGPCPSDMRPGDVVANGRMINLLEGK